MIEFQLLGWLSRRKPLIERKRHHGLEGLSDKKAKNVPYELRQKRLKARGKTSPYEVKY